MQLYSWMCDSYEHIIIKYATPKKASKINKSQIHVSLQLEIPSYHLLAILASYRFINKI